MVVLSWAFISHLRKWKWLRAGYSSECNIRHGRYNHYWTSSSTLQHNIHFSSLYKSFINTAHKDGSSRQAAVWRGLKSSAFSCRMDCNIYISQVALQTVRFTVAVHVGYWDDIANPAMLKWYLKLWHHTALDTERSYFNSTLWSCHNYTRISSTVSIFLRCNIITWISSGPD